MTASAADDTIRVVLFAGGRGAGTIARALAHHPQISLTILVNAYDDGLSTGRLRQLVPGMLGPSDIRKNYSQLLPDTDPTARPLKGLLEYRFPTPADTTEVVRELTTLGQGEIPDGSLAPFLERMALGEANAVAGYTRAFLRYWEEESRAGHSFDFSDCSLGNILFVGCYLENGRDFNRAIDGLCGVHPVASRILNVTEGKNLVLVGLKSDGTLLANEAELVSKQSSFPIHDIYLLDAYLSREELSEFERLSLDEKHAFLQSRSQEPELNPEAREAILGAEIIIYGPGTQHSSLLPSYMTRGIGEAIAQNVSAEKIFIGNIRRDHEIQAESVNSLYRKLTYYLSHKGRVSLESRELVTRVFFQKSTEGVDATDYVPLVAQDGGLPSRGVGANWETHHGVHLGEKVLDEIIAIANERAQHKLRPYAYMVSIIVPGLDEERTVGRVLHELTLLNLQPFGLAKEIVFVDGGSKDATYELARKETGVRAFRLPEGSKRGEALRFGIDQAQGNIILFFPSDGEYNVQDIIPILTAITRNEFEVVFGSRAIKCVHLGQRIREIYAHNYLGYLVSKYGGMLLSVINLVLFNRFLSDPLTGIKAFQARLIKGLNLRCRGVDLDMEIIAKLGLRHVFILEVPVEYYPRKKSEGKKTSVWDGLQALFSLFRFRWSGL